MQENISTNQKRVLTFVNSSRNSSSIPSQTTDDVLTFNVAGMF